MLASHQPLRALVNDFFRVEVQTNVSSSGNTAIIEMQLMTLEQAKEPLEQET
jgi:hypothetical protein